MSTTPATIKLSPRRHQQLRSIASTLGLSITDTIGHLVNKEIAAGTIPNTIPGIVVRRLDDGVLIQIDDNEPATVALDTARKIVEALRSVANGGSGIVHPSPFDASKSFGVVRQGTGIKLQVPFHGPTAKKLADAPAFPADLAHDLAALIEQAAA